jgi:hypothetical protein
MDGVSAPYVVVSFRPTGSKAWHGGSGTTDSQGKFAIGENGKESGLPAGEYKVTFSQTLVKGKPTLAGSGGKKAERVPTEKEAVPDDYRDAQKTPHTANIGSGPNNFTFDIKVKN